MRPMVYAFHPFGLSRPHPDGVMGYRGEGRLICFNTIKVDLLQYYYGVGRKPYHVHSVTEALQAQVQDVTDIAQHHVATQLSIFTLGSSAVGIKLKDSVVQLSTPYQSFPTPLY
ncbi:hypothetical protein AMTR_s00039p00206600 [Amborella trichopoda]|uniref:Uncharacterized protein n=1 Tax=Amborella trichopoda TaxID=13333 RepID=U5CRN8_AMBTC|nr:hypothetical protein AMTR_s00039p00206600 [Amborella trichopoda]